MLWKQNGVPHKGWDLVGVEDLGSVAETCEFCGTDIRYAHSISNPDYPDLIRVGCICAEHLTGDYTNPKAKENALRKQNRMEQQALKLKWARNEKGNLVVKYRGLWLTVYLISKDGPYQGQWSYFAGEERCRKPLESFTDAKVLAYKSARAQIDNRRKAREDWED